MIKERRVRRPPRVPTEEGKIILHELSARGTSLLGWLEDNGLGKRFQRTADNIIYGKITGKNNTKSATVKLATAKTPSVKSPFAGASRGIMLVMSDSFGIQWDWAKHLMPDELAEYRICLDKVKSAGVHEKMYRQSYPGKDFDAILKWLKSEKKGIVRMVRKNKLYRVTTFFRTCVKNRLCPVCFQDAEYSSAILINSKNSDPKRTKSVLTCVDNGCNSGLGIDIFNILEVIDPTPL